MSGEQERNPVTIHLSFPCEGRVLRSSRAALAPPAALGAWVRIVSHHQLGLVCHGRDLPRLDLFCFLIRSRNLVACLFETDNFILAAMILLRFFEFLVRNQNPRIQVVVKFGL